MTLAAATNGLADALELGKVLAMQFTEIVKGVSYASQLADMANNGEWTIPAKAVVDAVSIFRNIIAADIKLPLADRWSRS